MTIEYLDSKRISGLSDGVSSGYDVANISYSGKSSSSSSQNTYMLGIGFNADGTKMYRTGYSSTRAIFQYTLSTAWDISTASYDNVSFSLPSPQAVPYGIEWNGDGTKFVVGDSSTGDLYQYSLTTAYDISTTNSTPTTYDSSQATKPVAFKFINSGAKAFVLDNQTDTVFRYSLSTAYDITTMSYDSNSFQTADYYLTGMELNSDGTEMYLQDHVGNSLRRFTLSTAYDLSTASLTSSFSTSSQFGSSTTSALRFSADGTKLYISGYGASDFQYDTGSTASDKTLLTNVQDNSLFVEKNTARRYWFDKATSTTYESDFSSSTGWTTAGSGVSVDTVGETLDFNCVNGTNNGTSYDLQDILGSGVFLDSEKWLFRCKLVITTSTEHTDPNVNLEIGVSDSDKDTSFSSNRDGIGLQFNQSDGSSTGWYATEPDGASWNSAKTKFAYQDANIQTGTYYIEIRRLSPTSAEVRVSLDDFVTYQETESLTISATLDQLRYLIVQDRNDGSGTGNKLIGTIDDMKIYNGITTTTPATWTWDAIYIDDDFSSDSNWTSTGSGATVTNGEVKLYHTGSSNAGHILHQTVPSFSSKAYITFDFIVTSRTSALDAPVFCISSGTGIPQTSTTDNSVMFEVNPQDSPSRVSLREKLGSGSLNTIIAQGSLGSYAVTGTRYYVKISIDGTTITVTTYTGSLSGSQVGSASGTISAITGRTIVKMGTWSNSLSRTHDIKLDNLKIYNGVTSI